VTSAASSIMGVGSVKHGKKKVGKKSARGVGKTNGVADGKRGGNGGNRGNKENAVNAALGVSAAIDISFASKDDLDLLQELRHSTEVGWFGEWFANWDGESDCLQDFRDSRGARGEEEVRVGMA
jgi:hypothetical protein